MTKSTLTPTKTDFCSLYWACRYLAFGEEPIQEDEARTLYEYDPHFCKDIDWWVGYYHLGSHEMPERNKKELAGYKNLKLAFIQGKLKPYVLHEGAFIDPPLTDDALKKIDIDPNQNRISVLADEDGAYIHQDGVYVSTSALLELFPKGSVVSVDVGHLSENEGKKGRPKKFNYGRYAAILAAGYVEAGWEKLSQDQLVEKVIEISQHMWPDEKHPSATSLENEIIREFTNLLPAVTKIVKNKASK